MSNVITDAFSFARHAVAPADVKMWHMKKSEQVLAQVGSSKTQRLDNMPSEDPYGAKRFLSGGVGGMAYRLLPL